MSSDSFILPENLVSFSSVWTLSEPLTRLFTPNEPQCCYSAHACVTCTRFGGVCFWCPVKQIISGC